MLAGLATRARETWRTVDEEQDPVRRWVLKAALLGACLLLLLGMIWLLNRLPRDQVTLTFDVIELLLYAALGAYLCRSIAIIVRRARHRLASEGRPSGIFRAAVWSFVKGDVSIKLACLLTLLLMARLWAGASGLIFPAAWIIYSLFTAGALPKDRYFLGTRRKASSGWKVVWVAVGVVSGLIVVNGLGEVQHCECSLAEAIPLMIEPIFYAVLVFTLCLIMINFSDPLARRRLKYD
jgi:hypothetical protein